jgi:hypothetical protein
MSLIAEEIDALTNGSETQDRSTLIMTRDCISALLTGLCRDHKVVVLIK